MLMREYKAKNKSAIKPIKTELSAFEQAKKSGVKGVRANMSQEKIKQMTVVHEAGNKAVNYVKSGVKQGLPQYKNAKESAIREFANVIHQNHYSVNQSNWTFSSRGLKSGVGKKLVEGGMIKEGDSKYNHELTQVGKELAHQIIVGKLKNAR